MKERPILFNGEMVRAILEGRKTQTRRIIKPQPSQFCDGLIHVPNSNEYEFTRHGRSDEIIISPYGQPGDRLWVRETFAKGRANFEERIGPSWKAKNGSQGGFIYRASTILEAQRLMNYKWKPSIHMPRWASRITLEIVNVRVERLQDISEEDANAEGVKPIPRSTQIKSLYDYRFPFKRLWTSINGPGAWEKNPFVWVIEFKRV